MTGRVRPPRRTLAVPPPAPAGNRAPIGPDTIRAAYDAHTGHEHAGRIGRDCSTCKRYLHALTASRATRPATGQQP